MKIITGTSKCRSIVASQWDTGFIYKTLERRINRLGRIKAQKIIIKMLINGRIGFILLVTFSRGTTLISAAFIEIKFSREPVKCQQLKRALICICLKKTFE